MKLGDKRGLSGVITTLILILLTLVAIGVIWVVVANLIGEGTDDIDIGKFTVRMEIKEVILNDNNLDVVVHRSSGNGDVTGLKIIIENDTDSEVFEFSDFVIDELETKTVNVAYDGYVKKVSIAPLLGEGGRITGNVKDSVVSEMEYIDNMDDVNDWSPITGENTVLEDIHYTSSNGILDFSVDFNDAGNEYGRLNRSVNTIVPEGQGRFIEIRYKIDTDGCSGGYYQVWPEVCSDDYGPRFSLPVSSTWRTEFIDIPAVVQIYSDPGEFCDGSYTGELRAVQLLIDDGACSANTPHLYVDYIKIGQTFS